MADVQKKLQALTDEFQKLQTGMSAAQLAVSRPMTIISYLLTITFLDQTN